MISLPTMSTSTEGISAIPTIAATSLGAKPRERHPATTLDDQCDDVASKQERETQQHDQTRRRQYVEDDFGQIGRREHVGSPQEPNQQTTGDHSEPAGQRDEQGYVLRRPP